MRRAAAETDCTSGGRPRFYISRPDGRLFSVRISGRAALLVHGDFVLNLRKTTLAFLRADVMRKARIFFPVEIVGLETGERVWSRSRGTDIASPLTILSLRPATRSRKACPGQATR